MSVWWPFLKPPEAHFLAGTWCIVSTSLSFWKTRQNPRIRYTPEPVLSPYRELCLRDEVLYTRNGKLQTVLGYDTPLSDTHFVWRGEPWYLRWLTSHWQVVLRGPEDCWVVTYFEKTLFTDAGVDVYAREATLDEAVLREIYGQMAEVEVLKPFVGQMFLTGWG